VKEVEKMSDLTVGLSSFLSWTAVFNLLFGTFCGIVIGALPGLTATMAVSLLVSLTYGLNTVDAVIILIAVYLGAIYGGSRSAILLNVPGTPSSAATALDGFPLTRKGEGNMVGVTVTTFSALGGLVGLLILGLATPTLANFALKFGVWEYFWMAVFGVFISSTLSASKLYKGLLSGFVGLLVSCVGMDAIRGAPRFTFGLNDLMGGLTLVPAMIGLFGIAEAFDAIRNPHSHTVADVPHQSMYKYVLNSFKLAVKKPILWLRSSVIGTFIGALPGVGPDIASWVAYGSAKRASKEKELFGNGSYEGVIASEAANNAATSGVFIPLLTLGIPGDAVSAVILGAIQLHGLRPGPTFFFSNVNFIYFICGALLLVNLIMWFEGIYLTTLIAKILKAHIGAIMPVVIVLCVIGSYAINLRSFDIAVMLGFGLLGLLMRQFEIPAAPMALGIILGEMGDLNLRRGILAGNGSLAPFFTRPISVFLYLVLLLMLVLPLIKQYYLRKKEAR
jgi:putative tricarboxylic transport membrane protein